MIEIKSMLPKTIVYEVTNRCNLRCQMCAQNFRNFNYADLSLEIVKKTEYLLNTATDVSLFGWGEPLLARNFLKIFEMVSKYKVDVFVLTNGMFLDDEISDAFIEYKLKYLNFSIDAPEAELYNYIRKGADFDHVIKNIKNFMKKCDKAGYYPYTRIVMVLMRKNIEYFPRLVELAYELGMNEVKGVYLIAYDEKMQNELLYFHQELTNRIFDQTQMIADRLNIKLTLPDRFGQGKRFFHKKCYRPWQELYIQSNGKVRGCCFSNEIMGDLCKESFEQIWNNKKFMELRKRVNSDYPPDDCRNCCHYRHINVDNIASHIRINAPVPNTTMDNI